MIRREEIRDLTASLGAIDSVNPDLVVGGAGEAEIATFVANWWREAGFDAIASVGPILTGITVLDHRLRDGAGHALLGTGSIHASLIEGGQELSTYPARCVLSIEGRTVPGETREIVEDEMQAILDEALANDPSFEAALRTLLVRDAFEVADDEPIVAVTEWIQQFWRPLASQRSSSVPNGEGAHADVEWVDLESAEKAANALLAIAREFCA